MTIRCNHCEFENNNYKYCSACGRELVLKKRNSFVKLPEGSAKFLVEVVNTIERVFYPEDITAPNIEIKNSAISMTEIARESGIFIIDNNQWKDVDKKTKTSCFYAEISITYILSLILAGIGFFAGSTGIDMTLKMFFTCFIFISFLLWFIFPYIAGSTVFAFSKFRCGLFVEKKQSVSGKPLLLLILFMFVMVYSFLPFFLFEYMLSSKLGNYTPAALKITGIDYLEKIGGN